jgi:hypothetical protein
MSKESVSKAIVIPVYKEKPDAFELISLEQCFKILGKYPVVIVCPSELNINIYADLALRFNVDFNVERFESSFFEGLMGYNRLMLSKNFYERFIHFDRILVYQTDCFVFRDDFDYWCKYDYAGAPWTHIPDASNFLIRRIKQNIKRQIKILLKKDNHMDAVMYRVGNGGFSIRNPKLFLKIIDQFEQNKRIDRYRNPDSPFYWEDVFWGIEVNKLKTNLRIPTFKEALNFSFENQPAFCYNLNNNRLPFGCHAWQRYDFDFWKPFVESTGYNLDINKD